MLVAFGRNRLDTDRYQLTRDGLPVRVEPRVLELLAALIDQPERVVTKDELLERLWPDLSVTESSLTRVVSLARRAIGDDPRRPELIRTVYGRGYAFIGALEEPAPATGPGEPAQRAEERRGEPGFVGRAGELVTLQDALRAALRSPGRLVSLVGEAGIGKTRMAEQVVRRCREEGALVLVGRCREDADAPAFWPWSQALRAALEAQPGLRDAFPSELVPLLTERRDGHEGTGAAEKTRGAGRFQLLDRLARFFLDLARRRPTLVVLDDLHRADLVSLEFLSFLSPEIRDAPLGLLLVYRDDAASLDRARAERLSSLASQTGATWLQLGGLSRDEVSLLLEAELGEAPDPEIVRRLHELTDGNPFFLTQLLPLVPPAGDGSRFDPAPLLADLPASVREAVGRQIRGLPGHTVEALELAAVVGREFSVELLARALGLESSAALEALEPARARRILADHPELPLHLRFAHALVQEVVHDRQPRRIRATRHLRVARALEESGPPAQEHQLPDLARHYREAAVLGHADKALDYAKRAGQWAAARYAYEDAVRHYSVAHQLLPVVGLARIEQCDLLIGLAEALTRSGERAAGRETFATAVALANELGASERIAQAALSLSPGVLVMEVGGYDPTLVGILEDALAALSESDTALRAHVLGRLALARLWATGSCWLEESDEALALARSTGDEAVVLSVLSCWLPARWGIESLEARLSASEQLVKGGARLGLTGISAVGRILQMCALLCAGDLGEIEAELSILGRERGTRAHPELGWYVPLFRALVTMARGEFAPAEAYVAEFASAGRKVGDQNAIHAAAGHLMLLQWERASLRDSVASVRHLADSYRSVAGWRAGLIWVLSEVGLLEEAHRELNELLDEGFMEQTPRPDGMIGAVLLAESAERLNHREAAAKAYERLLPKEHEFAVAGFCASSWGAVSRSLGLAAWTLGRRAEAVARLRRAIELNRRSGFAAWAVRSQFDLARVLAEGDRAEVGESLGLLAEARETAVAKGMSQLAANAEGLETIVVKSPHSPPARIGNFAGTQGKGTEHRDSPVGRRKVDA